MPIWVQLAGAGKSAISTLGAFRHLDMGAPERCSYVLSRVDLPVLLAAQ
jgi:hypothetical protein